MPKRPKYIQDFVYFFVAVNKELDKDLVKISPLFVGAMYLQDRDISSHDI